jgi:hypothetical protein
VPVCASRPGKLDRLLPLSRDSSGIGVKNAFLSLVWRAYTVISPLSQLWVKVALNWPPLSAGNWVSRTPSVTR